MRPALIDAVTDTRLKGAPKEVLFYLHTILDPGEWRTLKLWPVAKALQMNKSTTGRAITTLLRCGYIREGPRQEHGQRCFKVLTTLGEPAKRSA